MINRPFIFSALTAAMIIFSGNTFAEDQQPVRGSQLMTEQERLQHREKMQNAKTAEERQQIQKANHVLMRARAEARGLKLRQRPTDSQGPVRGSQLMTEQERRQHHERMQNAKTAEERQQIQKANHEFMRARAEARGLKLRESSENRGHGTGTGMGAGAGPGSGSGQGKK